MEIASKLQNAAAVTEPCAFPESTGKCSWSLLIYLSQLIDFGRISVWWGVSSFICVILLLLKARTFLQPSVSGAGKIISWRNTHSDLWPHLTITDACVCVCVCVWSLCEIRKAGWLIPGHCGEKYTHTVQRLGQRKLRINKKINKQSRGWNETRDCPPWSCSRDSSPCVSVRLSEHLSQSKQLLLGKRGLYRRSGADLFAHRPDERPYQPLSALTSLTHNDEQARTNVHSYNSARIVVSLCPIYTVCLTWTAPTHAPLFPRGEKITSTLAKPLSLDPRTLNEPLCPSVNNSDSTWCWQEHC